MVEGKVMQCHEILLFPNISHDKLSALMGICFLRTDETRIALETPCLAILDLTPR